MVRIGKPRITQRARLGYMGIRVIAPFKGMSQQVSELAFEVNDWVERCRIKTTGPPFLRFHVIDMRGFMDVSYGVPLRKRLADDGHIKADVIPAGRYASLVYSGGGISANRALIEWVRDQQLEFDRWDTLEGDNFRGRYETYLTDPKVEPRRSKWEIEVAIKLAGKRPVRKQPAP